MTKQLAEAVSPAPTDQETLAALYQKTLRQFNLVGSLITTREPATAQKLIKAKNEINVSCLDQKKNSLWVLKAGGPAGVFGEHLVTGFIGWPAALQ